MSTNHLLQETSKKPTAPPPGPRSRFPGETLLAFQRDPSGYLETLARTYGDLVAFRLGPIQTFLLNHPALIKEVLVTQNRNFRLGFAHQRVRYLFGDGLVTSEGQVHLRERRLIQPMFHSQEIAKSADTAVAFAAQWRTERREDEVLEIGHAMWALTLNLICKTLFNTSVQSEIDEISDAIGDVTRTFSPLMMLAADWVLKLHLPPGQRFRRAQARLDRTMFRIIHEHRARGDQGDLLSLLLRAAETSNTMTEEQVRDEVLTFFIAGHGTTAAMLTWAFFLLAEHPEKEAQLLAEIDQVLNGRLPTLTDLHKLQYCRSVLVEALRLYSPVWGMDREVVRECQVGGHTLPKGALVLLSQWVTHHDARFFPDPYRFEPERWMHGEPDKYAYFPFSAGPRVCVGEELTYMNGVLLLTTLLQKWRLCIVQGQEITPRAGTTLYPKNGIRMQFKARR